MSLKLNLRIFCQDCHAWLYNYEVDVFNEASHDIFLDRCWDCKTRGEDKAYEEGVSNTKEEARLFRERIENACEPDK